MPDRGLDVSQAEIDLDSGHHRLDPDLLHLMALFLVTSPVFDVVGAELQIPFRELQMVPRRQQRGLRSAVSEALAHMVRARQPNKRQS